MRSRISREDKFRIYDSTVWRDDGRCQICDGPGQELAHVVPRSRSVKDDARLWEQQNLALLCKRCHMASENFESRIKLMQRLSARWGYTYAGEMYDEYRAYL